MTMTPPADLSAQVEAMFADGIGTLEAARRELPETAAAAAAALAESLAHGGKILICGNGGSASDSLHFSSELLNKFERVRRPLAAVSLSADISALTSIANDESYDAVFSKQIEALGRDGDMLVAITTSGNSPNILQAVRAAHAANMRCVALNGKGGGELSKLLGANDIDIIAPGRSTARIQEIHGILIHAFCDLIDRQLFGDAKS